MLRSIKDLIGYPVLAQDGKAGKVHDVLFGDRHWRMRFLDVETRTGFHLNLRYLSEEDAGETLATRFLLTPDQLMEPKVGIDRRSITTLLGRNEIRNCPSFVQKKSAEEQYDYEFRRFFRHGIYDDRPMVMMPTSAVGYNPPTSAYEHSDEELQEHLKRMEKIGAEHMHSARSVMGYRVRGSHGELGVVGDLILNAETWSIGYIVLDTKHGIPSRKYLISMAEVEGLDWSTSSMKIRLSKEDLIKERRFWPYDPVNHDEQEHDYDYYGKPCLRMLMEEFY